MIIVNKRGPITIGAVDFIILAFSLFLTLALRYHILPTETLINMHVLPFSIIFAYSIVVFYISGLYGRDIFLNRRSVPGRIIRSQIINGLIAVALFYFIPNFYVTPKIVLFAYIALSSSILILWRLSTNSVFSLKQRYPALVIGSGKEVDEIVHEMKMNPNLGLSCSNKIDSLKDKSLVSSLEQGNGFQYIVADINNPDISASLPEIYSKFFSKTQIIDINSLYEQIFKKIPLSCMNYAWIMSHISTASPKMYDATKRVMDILSGIIITTFTALIYPFVALAIKIEDRGSIFIRQERTGRNGKPIHFYKFRSMQRNDNGKWVPESTQNENKITRVGYFLRKTRLDEFPQGLALIKGDMSLVGPRSDISGLNERLQNEIPYYSIRTIVKPGLTGWAQTNQNIPPQSVEETKVRLSYDLYYIKHRSIGLDLSIILKTFKTLLSREGM